MLFIVFVTASTAFLTVPGVGKEKRVVTDRFFFERKI